jgi:hypothetical protein
MGLPGNLALAGTGDIRPSLGLPAARQGRDQRSRYSRDQQTSAHQEHYYSPSRGDASVGPDASARGELCFSR